MRQQPAGDFDYQQAPRYATHRRTDPRIAALVHDALGDARTVLNVGAGAGSYEPEDRYVLAVEPAAQMRAQRSREHAPAIDAVAEALPFDDDSFDASMAMITIHQWPDWATGLAEMRRVAREAVVVLTFDGDELERLWLSEYVPELFEAERRRYPAIKAIADALGGGEVLEVPIPIDCADGFTEAFYARPRSYLDEDVRRSQSAWGFVEQMAIDRGLDRLREDLESGRWHERHGHLLEQAEFVGAVRLVVSAR